MKSKLTVVKVGGNLLEDQLRCQKILTAFAKAESPKILVHGGGKLASKLAMDLGITVNMHEGRRITDGATLEVIVMAYAGKVNKEVVAALQKEGCDAIGLSGADANLIQAIKRPVAEVDFGFAGDITQVHTKTLLALLDLGLVPVFCALTHDGKGQLLNTNADTIAAALCGALSDHYEVTLKYCFEKKGVLRDVEDEASVIPEITPNTVQQLIATGVISDGMLPKIHNSLKALQSGAKAVHIGNEEIINGTAKHFTTLRHE
ncbi:acetylglutamate kinase [Croceiramulus getboli]|nr:acetylglutamate kinase [Flavobacteriaceae bacterium YJPT1-3]